MIDILYGIDSNKINVTDTCLNKLTTDNIINIPPDDDVRARIFSDPLPYILKKIYIIIDNNLYTYSDKYDIKINTITNTINATHVDNAISCNNKLKILILILSSPDINPVYNLHKQVWLSYMNSDPNIDCYFIEYNNSIFLNTNNNVLFEGNTIYVKGEESYNPGCREKTFDCYDYFLNSKSNNLYDYDYVIRTNMSSLWNFSALHKYLSTLDRKGVYCGPCGYDSDNDTYYASGTGIIMTPDIVELLIKNRHLSELCNIIDDVDIGFILKTLNVKLIGSSRYNIHSMHMFNNFNYNHDIYHYRVNWNNCNLRYEEPIVMAKILKLMK